MGKDCVPMPECDVFDTELDSATLFQWFGVCVLSNLHQIKEGNGAKARRRFFLGQGGDEAECLDGFKDG